MRSLLLLVDYKDTVVKSDMRQLVEQLNKSERVEMNKSLLTCPFIASMAASDASKLAKLTKAYPFELPVSGSRMILGVCKMTPNAENVS